MRRTDSSPALALIVVLTCWLACPVAAQIDAPTRFAADRPVDCLHIRLDLDVDVERKHVKGRATIDLAALRALSTIRLDAIDLSTSAVLLSRADGEPAPASHINDGRKIEVTLDVPLEPGEKVRLIVDYTVDDPESGLHFYGPTPDEPDVPWVVWSQGEPIHNSHWFPCLDHPNERQTTELIVTAKKEFEVSSNGRLVSRREDADDGTVTVHWSQDKPHVAYLVSLIAGEFHVTRESWREMPVEYWVHPQYKDDVERSFGRTLRMLDFFTDRIGVKYPWDRYAQICCEGFGGGMENTAATTLGNRALHDARSFIDSNSDGLIAHELAHQWWGDLLTCRDWAHLWLNEGFASYSEALWAEHDLGADEFEYNMDRKARSARAGGGERPIVDRAYDHPRSMFDSRAYPKGAWVLHMMRRRLGDDLFWKVLNRYATEYAYQCVETVDLRRTVERVTGRSFERFFHDWTARPGHPEVTVGFEWLAEEKLARVEVRQTQKAEAFHFPLELEFHFDGDRGPRKLTRFVDEKEMTIYHPLAEAPTLVRVDPRQAVLMELKQDKGRNLWEAQLLGDPSAAARIEAARHFGASRREADRSLLARSLREEEFWGVRSEVAAALAETGGDLARDALLEGLRCDHPKVRRACVEALRSFRDDPLVLEAVRPLVVKGDPSYYVESSAISLFASIAPPDGLEVLINVLSRDSRGEIIRSAALSGLGRLRQPVVPGLLCEWTRRDKPRRCRPTALRALADWTRTNPVDESTMEQIVAALAASLEDTGTRVRSAAVRALGSLGDPGKARSALPALETIAATERSRRIRDAATRTIEAIEAGKPAQIRVDELRGQLKEALEQNKALEDRIEKLEARLDGEE